MPTAEEMFARWKWMAGDTSPRPWSSENMAGFFQLFRPLGDGVEAAFDGVAGAEDLLPRLLDVYRATAAGWSREGHADAYFLVRHPLTLPRADVADLLRSHLGRLAAAAAEVGDDEASGLLGGPLRLEVVEGQTPWPPGDDDPETLIYEMTGDFVRSLSPRPSHALLMGEAFYHIACDYGLRHHLLWPLYRHATDIEEPFLPYFELWRHGIGYRFVGEEKVVAFVPPVKPVG
jgi:hypothetical protein